LFLAAAVLAPDRATRVEVLCDALLTCLASAPAMWVLETAAVALDQVEKGTPQHRLLRFIESYAELVCRCDPRRAEPMTAELIRVGARSVWAGQGWSLTVAVHAVNM